MTKPTEAYQNSAETLMPEPLYDIHEQHPLKGGGKW